MADISTGRQRGIVPFVDETTGRLPDQYLPQGVIDLQGDLEQAVSDASQSATAAKASETAAKASADSATQSASAAAQSAESASGDAAAAKASAGEASSSASAAKASETAASSSATAAQQSASQAQSSMSTANSSAQAAAASAESAKTATESASSSKDAAARSASEASESAQAAEASKTNAAASATAAQNAVDGFGLEVGTTTTGEPGSDASVNIAKQETKYVADFTIPRGPRGPQGPQGPQGPKGDPGDLTAVAHDSTLTGNGTRTNPLGAAIGSALNQGQTNRDVDLNTYTSPGIYGIASNNAQNCPSETTSKMLRAALLVSYCGYGASDGVVLQTLFARNISLRDVGIYMRALRSGKWDEWKQMASMSDVSDLTSRITTLQAGLDEIAVMQTRLQALETRIKSLETN